MIDAANPILATSALTVTTTSGRVIVRDVSLEVPRNCVTALIGPSGAGKTTLLRCFNRLVDLSPALRVSGNVTFEGIDTRGPGVDPSELRRNIGIVFQQPVTFPGSIAKNVLFAAKRLGLVPRNGEEECVERCLTAAGLWRETRDRLGEPATTLSVGQQQRLALARVLAGDPAVILMDEPTSALDPRTTEALEETIGALKASKTIVLVTHHLAQARRLADWIACICPRDGAGELIDADRCEVIFESPAREETIEFLGCAGGGRC